MAPPFGQTRYERTAVWERSVEDGLRGERIDQALVWIGRTTGAPCMSEREIWQRAVAIVAEYGEDAPRHVLTSFDDDFTNPGAVTGWHRVALAVDAILACRPQ